MPTGLEQYCGSPAAPMHTAAETEDIAGPVVASSAAWKGTLHGRGPSNASSRSAVFWSHVLRQMEGRAGREVVTDPSATAAPTDAPMLTIAAQLGHGIRQGAVECSYLI